MAKARGAPKEKLQVFLFNDLFAIREDKSGGLFSGKDPSRANWTLPLQLWLKEDTGSDTGALFLGPHEGFYVNFPSAEIRNAWVESVKEIVQGIEERSLRRILTLPTDDGYREFEYMFNEDKIYSGRWFAGKVRGFYLI